MDLGEMAGPRMEGTVAPEQNVHHGGADVVAPEIEKTTEASGLGDKDKSGQTSETAAEVPKDKASGPPQPPPQKKQQQQKPAQQQQR